VGTRWLTRLLWTQDVATGVNACPDSALEPLRHPAGAGDLVVQVGAASGSVGHLVLEAKVSDI
jgi:hypothetical protein